MVESVALSMVDKQWLAGFQKMVGDFRHRHAGGGPVVSIKVRVESGCFHREHSPEAFKIIDARLGQLPDTLEAVEHENGPELLVSLAVAAGALSLAKSVIELVTEIIKARSVGVKKGDHPREPLVLIVRRVDERNDYREDVVLRIGHADKVDSDLIEDRLNTAIRDLFKDEK